MKLEDKQKLESLLEQGCDDDISDFLNQLERKYPDQSVFTEMYDKFYPHGENFEVSQETRIDMIYDFLNEIPIE